MRWLTLLLAFTVTGCVSPVVIDHRTDTDFSRYHSYSLVSPQQDQHALSLDDQRIRKALRVALARSGLKAAEASEADMQVRYRLEPVAHFEGRAVQFGFGIWHHGVGLSTETPVEGITVQEHKLQVEMIDSSNRKVIWQATSRDTLRPDMAGEQRDARVREMVRDMFQRYPPETAPDTAAVSRSAS